MMRLPKKYELLVLPTPAKILERFKESLCDRKAAKWQLKILFGHMAAVAGRINNLTPCP
ncbi:MAG: hypothetical protein AAFX80_09440 [Cyanobacteria bacterium J06639_18]